APVHAYALEGLGTLRTRFDRSRARGLSRFVGRDDEMHVLQSALARAQQGDGQANGEPWRSGRHSNPCGSGAILRPYASTRRCVPTLVPTRRRALTTASRPPTA
ncbi:MAG TPA: hypothetical protein VMW17_00595, partial [Candidatus Binatia bacterium]|nr:hypothetical protein [Candidatus Binatia bacterium]